MMMKKTTSALAVAALLGTGAASAATFQVNDDTSLTVGGDVEISYQDFNTDAGNSDSDMTDGGSQFGFSGEHVAANGLTSFFEVVLDGIDATAKDTGSLKTDEANVGLAGDFGSVLVGSNASAYDELQNFSDYMSDASVTTPGLGDNENLIQYQSPAVNGFAFTGEVKINDDQQTAGDHSFVGKVTADLGSVNLVVAYDQREDEASLDELYGVGAGFAIAGVDLGVAYQKSNSPAADANEFDIMTANFSTSYGPGNIYGVVQSVDYDAAPVSGNTADPKSQNEYAVGVNYNVSSVMHVFGEYRSLDKTNDEDDGFAIGTAYKF